MKWTDKILLALGAAGVLAVGLFHEQGPSEYNRAIWGALIGAAVSLYTANKASKQSKKEAKRLAQLAAADYTSYDQQRFLPPALRSANTDAILQSGIQGIGDLIRNPGRLSPTVSSAILPRLAMESENLAQNFRGIQSQQAGQLARGNAPISIKGALASALDVAQARGQRDLRRQALTDSDALRRQDLGQTYNLMDVILQYLSSGRGQAIPGLNSAANLSNQARATMLGTAGSVAGNVGSALDQWLQNRAAMQAGGGAVNATTGGIRTGANTASL